jgi:hypothetical protein
MKLTIAVAAHKPFPLPKDPLYLPVQAGRAIHEPLNFTGDNTGENISCRNESFCELTVLYWAWKNLDADCVGLCHYRRYFAGKVFGKKQDRILTSEQAANVLKDCEVVLPKPRNYFIETNYSQYAHAHHSSDLDAARTVIAAYHPDYLDAFDRVMQRSWGHRFNMCIMRREVLDRYCSWLFDILFRLESQIDITGYSSYDRRVFGFLAERLLDVWLETEKPICRHLNVVHTEGQNWPRKILSFLWRKIKNMGKN